MTRTELYLITPNEHDDQSLLRLVAASLSEGCRYLQYRNKAPGIGEKQRRRQALAIANYIEQQGLKVQLIINDHPWLAQECGAGVHLGHTDATLEMARCLLGEDSYIGVSCGNDWRYACTQPKAQCYAFGAYRPSTTKADTQALSLDTIQAAYAQGIRHIAMVGGITQEDIPMLCAYPIRWLCMSQAIYADPHSVGLKTRACMDQLERCAYHEAI